MRPGRVVERHRERQSVGRVLEERVVLHLHFVEEESLVEVSESERLGVRHEVYLVPSLRELYPKSRGDGARAPVRGVTGDSDFHALNTPLIPLLPTLTSRLPAPVRPGPSGAGARRYG